MNEKNILIGAQVFLLAKNYKPTWTQNHPSAYGRRMVLCPALEIYQPKVVKRYLVFLIV